MDVSKNGFVIANPNLAVGDSAASCRRVVLDGTNGAHIITGPSGSTAAGLLVGNPTHDTSGNYDFREVTVGSNVYVVSVS